MGTSQRRLWTRSFRQLSSAEDDQERTSTSCLCLQRPARSLLAPSLLAPSLLAPTRAPTKAQPRLQRRLPLRHPQRRRQQLLPRPRRPRRRQLPPKPKRPRQLRCRPQLPLRPRQLRRLQRRLQRPQLRLQLRLQRRPQPPPRLRPQLRRLRHLRRSSCSRCHRRRPARRWAPATAPPTAGWCCTTPRRRPCCPIASRLRWRTAARRTTPTFTCRAWRLRVRHGLLHVCARPEARRPGGVHGHLLGRRPCVRLQWLWRPGRVRVMSPSKYAASAALAMGNCSEDDGL